MNMKTILAISTIIVLTSFNASGQQDPMLSQYMFNGLYVNSAYAGSHQYWSSSLTYRAQWVGANFEGAPQTMVASVDGPIRDKNMGLGFITVLDEVGVTRTGVGMAVYSYQLKLNDKSKLAFGVNAGFSQVTSNLRDVKIWDEEDEIYANNLTQIMPRIGAGVYYFSDRYFAGVAIPTLISHEGGTEFNIDVSKNTFIKRHYITTAGAVFDINEKWKLRPSVLLKYTKAAPLEGDINVSAIFNDAFWFGSSFRTGDAVALMLQYQTNSYFRVGYSYDITVSGLRTYQNGSHEIMIGVDFGRELKKIKTPRYF
jgi:type IX secretion system PorP/SprF family membrane protein